MVRSYDVGPSDGLTVPAALRYLHDVAQEHAGYHGFGYADLQSRGLAWALVALDLRFRKTIPGGAEFAVDTSVARYGGPLVYRDYVASFGESRAVVGQSMWVLIDLETRKGATMPDDLKRQLSKIVSPIQSEVERVARLSAEAEAEVLHAHTVGFNDCDFNGHLNNVVSVRWMLDAAYAQLPELKAGNFRLQVTYLHELLEGERADVCRQGQHFSLVKEDGTVAVVGMACGAETASGGEEGLRR